MTNEEAIKELIDASHREVKYGDTNNHYYEIMMRIEAFDMAIKALETQPCEDCISRAKALEMLGDEPENWTDTEKEIQEVNDYRWFKSILEELPSVTPLIPNVENEFDIGYNCGYTDAMLDISEGSESVCK